jgi:predicted dehydrogenase
MLRTTRRKFLKHAGLSALSATSAVQLTSALRAAGANRRMRIGLIGCGGRGTGVAGTFSKLPDVEIAWTCDPDSTRAGKTAEKLGSDSSSKPQVVHDLRKVLDDKTVDAVIVATPDHWHGPATLLAIAAGKHVYVEKPCCHNIREGRLMIDAARQNKRVVQTGTQSRSGPHVIEALSRLRGGAIGEVLIAKAWNSQKRRDIGHASPGTPPAELDYDLWIGPAPFVPYQANRLHYNWHWWYAFGTGDFGNDGVHDIDLARAGLGVTTHPTRIVAAGGKAAFDDDQQFPDTQTCIFEYANTTKTGGAKQLIFEMRIWSPYRQEGYENGCAFYGTEGMMLLGKGDDWQQFGPKNQLVASGKFEDREVPHARNFLDCIASGKHPNADIEIGHVSAALCHLGNIAVRTGRALNFERKTEQITGDEAANKLVSRDYRPGHWAVPRGA